MEPLSAPGQSPFGLTAPFARAAVLAVHGAFALAVLVPPGGSFGLYPVCAVVLLLANWRLSGIVRLGPTRQAALTTVLMSAAGVCGMVGATLSADALVRYFTYIGYLLAFLAVMGRPVVAVLSFAFANTAMVVALHLRTGLSIGELFEAAPMPQIVNGPAVLVFALGWYAVQLRLRRRIELEETGRAAAAIREGAAHEAMRARSRDLARAFAAAEPLLRRAAAGTLTPEDRRQALIVEATLRDRLRATRLAEEPLSSAVARARERGVEIDLLDDGPPREPLPAGLLDRVAAVVRDAVAGERLTIRLDPWGGPDLGSLVVERSDGSTHRQPLHRSVGGGSGSAGVRE